MRVWSFFAPDWYRDLFSLFIRFYLLPSGSGSDLFIVGGSPFWPR